MTKAENFLAELQHEATATRKILSLVPIDKLGWKPHEKSMPLGRVATHVAEVTGWFKETLLQDVLDLAEGDYKPFEPKSTEELLAFFDKNLKSAEDSLKDFPDDKMSDIWTMKEGDNVYLTMPREQVARFWCMNHLVHHRAQLGVYLRMLDVALPGTYGPSADGQ